MPQIKVPAVLAGGSSSTTHQVSGETIRDAFDAHAAEYGPELRDSVIDEDGTVKEFINVYVNGEEISQLAGVDTVVTDDDVIRVIPAASGGTAVD